MPKYINNKLLEAILEILKVLELAQFHAKLID